MIKKVALLCFAFFTIVNVAMAQNWGGGNDEEQINFGFTFQYISSEYKIVKKRDWRNPYFDPGLGNYVTDVLSAVSSPPSTGFGIGFVVKGRATEHVDVRFTPTLVFSDRIINYHYVVPGTYNSQNPLIEKKYQATMVEFPLGLKLKSDRLMNFRAYMLGGLKYSVDLASAKKTNDADAAPIDKLIKNDKSFLSYEAGLGFDIYFEYFKLSPELKLSYSFKDILKHDDTPFANPIERAKLRHFTFSLFFE
jgi:hypothetical protein